MKIQLKRSNVLESGKAKAPTSTQMEYGELAVNYNTSDPVIFIKDSDNGIIRLTNINQVISWDDITGKPIIPAEANDGEINIEILENGGQITQETRLYNADKDETRPMRSKENAHDYRYFPDPDLLPLIIHTDLIESVRLELPELPAQKRLRFIEQYGLTDYDATLMVSSIAMADYYETVVKVSGNPKLAANWMMGEFDHPDPKPLDLSYADKVIRWDKYEKYVKKNGIRIQ